MRWLSWLFNSESGGEMKQSKDRRRRAQWLAAATAVLTVATLPLLATPAHADTVRSLSWHLDSLRISRAQQITKGAGVTVAVIDTGVQADHQDLVGQVVPGKAFAVDVAADGRTDPDKEVSHGTGMASLIAGRGGGQQRMLGIAPAAKIMPASIGMSKETAAEAIRWAADQRVGVINLSAEPSAGDFSAPINDALAYALRRDVVVVASAGNRGGDLSDFARQPGVISVGAVDRKGKVWENSSHGHQLAVSAPGVDVIMSVNSGNGYGVGDGTSAATAITAGVVALIRARFPDLNAANVVNRLIKTTTDKGEKGRDSFYGFGVIDPVRALTANIPPVDVNPLGVAPAVPDGTASGAAGDENGDDDGSGLGIRVRADPGGLLLYGLPCLAVVAGIVVLIVWSNRRRRRRLATQPQAGGTYPPPSGQWGAPPPGHGQVPPGYGTQAQQPRYPAPPQQPGYGPPPQRPTFGPPPAQPGYGPPPRQPGYGPPPGQGPQPGQPGYPTPPGQAGYGRGSESAGPAPAQPDSGAAAPQAPAPPGYGQPPAAQQQPPQSGDR
jgi:type VII secretion-associated serine protease mycosin